MSLPSAVAYSTCPWSAIASLQPEITASPQRPGDSANVAVGQRDPVFSPSPAGEGSTPRRGGGVGLCRKFDRAERGTPPGSLRSPPSPLQEKMKGVRLRRLFDHFGSVAQQRLGNGEAEPLGGLLVDHHLGLGRELHRHVGRLLALEDAAGIGAGDAVVLVKI